MKHEMCYAKDMELYDEDNGELIKGCKQGSAVIMCAF